MATEENNDIHLHDSLRHYYWPGQRSTATEGTSYTCDGGTALRNLNMNNCTHDCDRQYYLYLPSAACDNSTTIGTLPLVFAVHCLGCSAETMMHWTEIAEQYHFVLAMPEGLQSSFNAQHCCGYALEEKVDDVGFLQVIIHELEKEFSFVSSDLAYALGWSNGGYMVSYAARLFRAIAPISGYQVDLNNRKDRPTAIFLHHAQDDKFVRATGCCTNASMPRCCCGISSFTDTCTSAEAKMQEWASMDVNGCQGNNGNSASVLPIPQITVAKPDAVTCYTYKNCAANTTYCIHQHKGHFNRPSFDAAFPMSMEIADFFARNACNAYGHGRWMEETSRCICQEGTDGAKLEQKYCTPPQGDDNIPTLLPPTSSLSEAPHDFRFVLILLVLIPIGALGMLYYYINSRKRVYKGFDKVSTVELRTL